MPATKEIMVLLLVLCVAGPAFAQSSTEGAQTATGEVTGNSVYVRSGPSLNHYPVMRLKAGDRVQIIDSKPEWYAITPPEGAFSLISGNFVDTADNRHGVVNGENVRVRAGSSIEAFEKKKSQVQLQLSKGAEVSILGENPDGFLRIRPPAGARLWITKQFVNKVSPDLIELEDKTRAATPTTTPTTTPAASGNATPQPATTTTALPAPVEESSPLAVLPSEESRKELEEIDALAKEEMAKPLLERDFAPLIERYEAIAAADEDELTKQYSTLRSDQLRRMIELIEAFKRVNGLAEHAEEVRREHLAQRAKIRVVSPSQPGGFDAEGELRPSAAFASKSGPQRYRLVDPSTPMGRTIGYVEIPRSSKLSAKDYLGRYVGVRASEKRLLTGGVDPIPIYVALELVPLERSSEEPTEIDNP